ncbi:MAG: hypothetical protein QOE28_1111 [Solirubrobacteraceae bacterium]|jgi:hypothetical protein|nr:hypothetical protein [Solirubrobacteraceae bacterium]
MRVSTTLKQLIGPTQTPIGAGAGVTIRYARPDEATALAQLAYLDSSRAPDGVVLVAEVAGELWAARSLEDGHAIADPFRPSGELSFLLAERARQLHRAAAATQPDRHAARLHSLRRA